MTSTAIGAANLVWYTTNNGTSYSTRTEKNPGAFSNTQFWQSSPIGFFSELRYKDPRFIEVAVAKGTATSGFSVIQYKNDGKVEATYKLGSVFQTGTTYDMYLLNATRTTGWVDIDQDSTLALINSGNNIEQLVSFKGPLLIEQGDYDGITGVLIGESDSGRYTMNQGSSYSAATTNTPGTYGGNRRERHLRRKSGSEFDGVQISYADATTYQQLLNEYIGQHLKNDLKNICNGPVDDVEVKYDGHVTLKNLEGKECNGCPRFDDKYGKVKKFNKDLEEGLVSSNDKPWRKPDSEDIRARRRRRAA